MAPQQYIRPKMWKDNVLKDDCYCITWYENNGIRYDYKSILLYDTSFKFPLFCKISEILINKTNSDLVTFLFKAYTTENYSEHFRAYLVMPIPKMFLLKFTEMPSNLPTMLHKLPGGNIYVSSSVTLNNIS